MSWRFNDSRAGAAIWDSEVPSAEDILCRNEELVWMAKQDQRRSWQLINGRIARKGDPTNALGSYGGLQAYPLAQSFSTGAVAASPGTQFWVPSTYTPLLGNAVMAPSVYLLRAGGTIQSSTTTNTILMAPSIGNTVAVGITLGNSVTSGVLGAGSALTAIWKLEGDMTIRTVGTAGTAWGQFAFNYGNAAGNTTSANWLTLPLGGTAASGIDFTGTTASLPGGLQMTGQAAVATVTVVVQYVHFIAFN